MFVLLLLVMSVIGLSVYLYRYFQHDLVAPPVVMAVMFSLSAICALFNVSTWKIDYSFLAYFYIVTGIAVFALPSLYYQRQGVAESYLVPNRYIDIAKWKILATAAINALLVVIFVAEMYRLTAAAGYDGKQIQWAFRELTSYQGKSQMNGIVRVIIRFMDVSAYLFGYVFIHNKLIYRNKAKKDWLLLLSPALFVLKTVISGGRLDVLKLLAAYILMSYILQKRKVGWDKDIAKKYIGIAVGGVAVGLPAFYYTLFLTGRTTQRSLFQSISTYLGGSIQHFNQYVQNPVPSKGFFGEESFIAILNILGKLKLIPYQRVVHLEYRPLGVTKGNVYTFFRRPLHDFGPIGLYVFVALVGLLFAYYYYRRIKHRKPTFILDVETVLYSYCFYWIFLSSIEQYSFALVSIHTLVFVVWLGAMAVFYWMIDVDWTTKKLLFLPPAPKQVERNLDYD